MRFMEQNNLKWNLLKLCAGILVFFSCVNAVGCQTDDERYEVQLKKCVEQGHNDLNGGIGCLKKLLKSNPGKHFVNLFLARNYRESGQFENAEKSINTFLAYYPAEASGYEVKCLILKDKNDFAGASTACATAVVREPEDISYLMTCAGVLEDFGETEKAESHYKLVLSKNPDNTNALAALGRLYEKAGKLDEAIATYEKLSELEVEFRDKIKEGIEKLKVKRELELNSEKKANENVLKQKKSKAKTVGSH